MTERYKVGFIYKTKAGGNFYVVGEHVKHKGYETVYNQYGKGRYNRSTPNTDNGRTTGSAWTENCLAYPPQVVCKINPVVVYVLNLFASACSLYQNVEYKVKYEWFN